MGKTGSKVNIASNIMPMIAKLELRFKPEKIYFKYGIYSNYA